MFPTSTVTPVPVSRMLPRYWAALGGALLAAAAVLIVAASVLSGSPTSNAATHDLGTTADGSRAELRVHDTNVGLQFSHCITPAGRQQTCTPVDGPTARQLLTARPN